jgi:hydroxypyruvate isomerase
MNTTTPHRRDWKLRFAAHLGVRSMEMPMFKSTLQSSDPIRHIEYAAALGFAGIEDNWLKMRPVDEQVRIGHALREHGLELGCFCNSLFASMPYWGADSLTADRDVLAEVDESIAAGRRAGGRNITVVCKRDFTIEAAYQRARMIVLLREAAKRVEDAGMVLCLEHTTEGRLPGMLLHHVSDSYEVAVAVDSPAVKLVFDVYHVQAMDGSLINNFKRVVDKVGVVQLSAMPDRLEPGLGEIHFPNLLSAMNAEGFDGLYELEHFNEQPGAEGEALALERLERINAEIVLR